MCEGMEGVRDERSKLPHIVLLLRIEVGFVLAVFTDSSSYHIKKSVSP